jgi:DNA-binding response OmpR family regulator
MTDSSSPEDVASSRPRRILVVDDHADALELYTFALERAGHAVTTASDGQSALFLLVEKTFDVAILDVGLPGIDGYKVATRARELLAERTPRLIAVSGYGHHRDRAEAAASGLDLYLVKPVELDVLLAAVARP